MFNTNKNYIKYIYFKAINESNSYFIITTTKKKHSFEFNVSIIKQEESTKKYQIDEKQIDLAKYNKKLTETTTSHVDVCITEQNNYLAFSFENQLKFININDKNRQIESIEFEKEFKITKLFEITKSNDLLLFCKENNHISYFDLKSKKLLAGKSFQQNGGSIKVKIINLILLVEEKLLKDEKEITQITLYDINRIKSYKSFDEATILKKEYLNEETLLYAITPNLKYFITYQGNNNILCLYRLKSSCDEIAKVPLFSKLTNLIANNKYVLMSIEDFFIFYFFLLVYLYSKF